MNLANQSNHPFKKLWLSLTSLKGDCYEIDLSKVM